jgi:glycosyltransferase involved in cell wall biosynthesis
VPWGVDYGLYPSRLPAPKSDGLVIGFIGTLLRHKGAHVAVQAVRQIESPGVRLLLYGSSFHEARYEAELHRLAAGDARIEFRGSYEHAGFASVLRELDAVVIPSVWHENLPTTGLNAIAAGVPVVVSATGGLIELIEDYRAGFAFHTGAAESLAALIRRLLEPSRLKRVRDEMRYPPSVEEEAWSMEQLYSEIAHRVATHS